MLIKFRLLGMGIMVGFFYLLIGVVSFWGVRNMVASTESLYSEHLKGAELLAFINEKMRDNRIQLLLAIQHDSRLETSKLHNHPTTIHTDQVIKNIDEITDSWKTFMAIPGKTDEERRLAEDYASKRKLFVQNGLLATREAVLAGRFDEAVSMTLSKINPLAAEAFESLGKLRALEAKLAKDAHEVAKNAYRTVTLVLTIAILLGIIIGTVINILVIRSINRGTSSLIKGAERLMRGDFSSDVEVIGKDEIANISSAFNSMRSSVATLIDQVVAATAKVATAAGQVMSTSEKIATGAEEVASQASTVATASEEMSATSGDIAQNCQMAAEGGQRASGTASSGAAVVEETVKVMSRIAERVTATARSVESLGTRSDQIGAIIGTIQDIADQTNLLALNAAIEAARAGEQGRGFAVVADEVRALAERTTKATREIGEMIKAIQHETKSAVAAMEEGVLEVEQGTSEAARSGQALQAILDQINEVTMQVHQVATAAEEQTATTSEISNNIHQITEVVQQTARGAQESASAAGQLTQTAEELQRLVGQFKI